MSETTGWVTEEQCQPTVVGEFSSILEITGTAGSDGSGGPDSSDSRTRVATAGAAVYQHVDGVIRFAFLFSKVPGTQTVPRAELWALYHLLRIMLGG